MAFYLINDKLVSFRVSMDMMIMKIVMNTDFESGGGGLHLIISGYFTVLLSRCVLLTTLSTTASWFKYPKSP